MHVGGEAEYWKLGIVLVPFIGCDPIYQVPSCFGQLWNMEAWYDGSSIMLANRQPPLFPKVRTTQSAIIIIRDDVLSRIRLLRHP